VLTGCVSQASSLIKEIEALGYALKLRIAELEAERLQQLQIRNC